MNWEKVKFLDAFDDITGGNQKYKTNEYLLTGNIPVIDQGKELIAGYIDNNLEAFNNLPVIIFGDHTRILKYIDFSFVLGADGVKIIKPKEGIDTKFAFYALQNVYIPNTGYNRHFKWLKESEIPLPDLATQKHIAEVLDKADALRQQNRQLLAHYDELLQSTFIELFGDPVKNPKGWEVKKLDKVCTQITDGTHFSPPSVDYGIPYITAKHVKNYGVDFYSKPTYVSIEEHMKIYARCKPEKGDVLYIKDGATTGIAAVNPYDFEFSMLSSLALIKPQKKELTSQFLVSWLNSEQVKENLINEFMAGAAIKRFTLQKIKSFQIPLPPLPLQQHFAKIVEQIEAQKAQAQAALAESEALFEGLLAGYFNA